MTHGTILLRSKTDRLLLQTPHDGHTAEAIWMLMTIPERVAQGRQWVTRIALRTLHQSGLLDNLANPEIVHRLFYREITDSSLLFEWHILDFASLIVMSYAPNQRWRVIPRNFYSWLASWEKPTKPRIQVIMHRDAFTIRVNHPLEELLEERFFSDQERFKGYNIRQLVEALDRDKPEAAQIQIRPKSIYVPVNAMLLEEQWRAALKALQDNP